MRQQVLQGGDTYPEVVPSTKIIVAPGGNSGTTAVGEAKKRRRYSRRGRWHNPTEVEVNPVVLFGDGNNGSKLNQAVQVQVISQMV